MSARDGIAGASLFHGLGARDCEPFAALARVEHVRKDDYLFRLGEAAHALLIVRSGVVQLTMPLTISGKRREVVVQELGAGETIAWSALVEPYRFTMSARAGTNVELLALPASELDAAVEAHPAAGVRVMKNLAQVIARRLHVMHTMWAREVQREVDEAFA